MNGTSRISARVAISIISFLLLAPGASAGVSDRASGSREALVDRIVQLSEAGDPPSMERVLASNLIEATKTFNKNVPDATWTAVHSDVDEIISRKIKSGYGEQALLARHFLENAKFSDAELEHLVSLLQDPVMKRWALAMQSSVSVGYVSKLTQQVNNQMWFMVSLVLKRHGLQTTYVPAAPKQTQ